MDSFAETQTRKADHLRICLDEDVQCRVTNGLERYRFVHNCLPDLNLSDIDLSTTFLGRSLGAPILISSMTGGTEFAKLINYRLAEIAQHYKLAMGVGSQRVAVENPQVADTFAIRSIAPNAVLLANLGAVQLNYRYGIDECRRVVELLEADALILHLNPLQECVQTQGDTNFRGLLEKIAVLCDKLPVPVVVKEVGNGISGCDRSETNRGGCGCDRRGRGRWHLLGKSRERTRAGSQTAPIRGNIRRLGHSDG